MVYAFEHNNNKVILTSDDLYNFKYFIQLLLINLSLLNMFL